MTVRSDGTWSASFTVPTNMAQGNYPLYGIGSPDRARTPFCVGAPSGTAPAPPSAVKNVNYGALNFRITWTDNSNNETGFEVYNGNEIRTVGANTSQYMWPAQPNQYMCIAVRAKNASGYSAWAGMWTCTTTPSGGQPKPPTNVSVTGYSTSALKISFVDQANNETAYQFWNSGETRTYNADVQGTGSTSSFLWTGLQPHTWMCFMARSYNEWGASAWSPGTTWACAYTLG